MKFDPLDVLRHAQEEEDKAARIVDKIACPKCEHYRSRVIDVRPSLQGGVYRRRECQRCHTRYSTEEVYRPYASKRTAPHDNTTSSGSTS